MTREERARRLGGTFGHLFLATPSLSGHERLRMAEHLSEERWANGWTRVAEQLEGERQGDGVLAFRDRRRPQLNARRIEHTIRRGGAGDVSDREDVLLTIPPSEFVEALTGETVPPHGMICCPLPGHEDRTPSCHVYVDPSRGWYCHGCHRGGTIYDLARELSGIGDRGRDFKELQTWIAQRVLGVTA
jgi:hypothetical protein